MGPQKMGINKELFKSILTLMTGSAAAQLIAILLQPVLRRMFIPELWGPYGVYVSLVSILAIVSTMRYEPAIVNPPTRREAVNLFFIAFYINLAFSVLLFTILALFLQPITAWLNISASYSWWFLFLPVSVMLFGSYQTMNYYLIREKAFGAISFNKAMRRAGEGATQLATGLLRWPAGLVAGDLAGHLANVVSGSIQLLRAGFTLRLHSFRLQKTLMRQYADYPAYYMLPMLLNSISIMAPLVLINKFYSQEIAGYFSLTQLVLITPAALLTMSVGQVFLQNISQKHREGLPFRRDLNQLTGILAAIAALMAIVLSLAGPWLLALYAGPPYEVAGQFARILVWGTFARIVVSPGSMVYVGLRKLKTQAMWQITYFLLVASLVFFRHLPVTQFIMVLAAVEIIAYSINFILIRRIVNKYHSGLKPGMP